MSTQKQRKAGKAPGRLSHLQCCSCDSTRKPDRNLTLERSNQSSFQNQCRDHSGQGARPRRQAAAQHPWIPTDPAPRLQLRAAPFDGASSTIIRGCKPPQPTIALCHPPVQTSTACICVKNRRGKKQCTYQFFARLISTQSLLQFVHHTAHGHTYYCDSTLLDMPLLCSHTHTNA